ncbi:hypothetical protein AVEN_238672-1 [Araneus ventricosus]|uniref:Uncharacterized protein n=1 Tax=Araneus ventricosus TaxID=182803 RepID=A0A4Y2BVT9_ARAVE|nr:hypothetical protein AVEN_238672-1 [Araneus ventricosus]
MYFEVASFFAVAWVAGAVLYDVPSAAAEFRSNRTGRVLKPTDKSPDRIVYKSGGYFDREVQAPSTTDNESETDRNDPPKMPRGFADFVSGEQDNYSPPADDQNRGWSPYYVPPLSDSMYDSSSSVDWNVYRREDERSSNNYADFPYPNYSPDYSDMIMMMQAMKKMDPNGGSKPGLLSRILDNPTTLVMATFIPISLLLAAALPVIVNVMMNGINIPSFVPTAGTKARGYGPENSTDLLRPILESLVDFNVRYLDSDDCFQKIFCEMTKENTTTVTNVPGAKYLKQAVNAATFIVNDDLLNTYGIKNLVDSVKSGKCENIQCEKKSRSLSPSLLRIINEEIYNYNFKS